MMAPLSYLFPLAAQVDPQVPTDHPLWPYWVAIGALSTAVATLFGVVMRQNSNFAAKLEETHETHRKMAEERSRRISEEFSKKDKAILDTSVEFARLMERVAQELATLNDRR